MTKPVLNECTKLHVRFRRMFNTFDIKIPYIILSNGRTVDSSFLLNTARDLELVAIGSRLSTSTLRNPIS